MTDKEYREIWNIYSWLNRGIEGHIEDNIYYCQHRLKMLLMEESSKRAEEETVKK